MQEDKSQKDSKVGEKKFFHILYIQIHHYIDLQDKCVSKCYKSDRTPNPGPLGGSVKLVKPLLGSEA